MLSCGRLFATPGTVACQASLSWVRNTGVGCHFLFQGIFLTQESNPELLHCIYNWATGEPKGALSVHACMHAKGCVGGVGYHVLLPGALPKQGLNPGLPHCRQILYCLRHQGSPRILESSQQSISSPEDLLDLAIKLGSPALQVDSLPAELSGSLI